MEDKITRCVNIDWLEVYVFENISKFPMNADYYRRLGYYVREREYGTRVYSEMFTIEDEKGNGFIEVRRNPQSGSSAFNGLTELSCHLRLCNRSCYSNSAVRDMAEFIIRHGYVFQRIFRIDVCYDFLKFDSGDDPARFIRNYIENKYSKVNQCRIRAIGDDAWASFDWESVAWGAPTSMVGTKMYNKTKEIMATGNQKPWIIQAWFESHLIDNPLDLPEVWRVEFSLHSTVRNLIVIEDVDRKKKKKKAVPHTMELYDGRDRLWHRFEELAHHYFQFRYVEYDNQVNSDSEKRLKRKDYCREKQLFKFNRNREFYQVQGLPNESKPDDKERLLRKHLAEYREKHSDMQLRNAIDVILTAIDRNSVRRITTHGWAAEIEQIRLAIATRTGWDYNRVVEIAEEIHKLIKQKEIW